MKTAFQLGVFVVALHATASAVGVGDTYAQVVAEKGQPGGKIEAGGAQILQYPDLTVKLRDGRVVSAETPIGRPSAPLPATDTRRELAASAKPAAKPAHESSAGAAAWTTNYKAALEKAKTEKRNVFLFFTGSDWCGWCMRLQKEILSTPEFARFAGEKLVLVELDFPQRKQISPALKAQNQELARKFEVRGYPTVIVLDGNGRPVGQLGYQPGGPGPFVERLKTM